MQSSKEYQGEIRKPSSVINRKKYRKTIEWEKLDISSRKLEVRLEISRSVVSNSLLPHGLQHARLSCPSPTPRACSNSCPLSQWCHPPHLILCRPLLLLPSIFPRIRIFSNESILCIRWPKYYSLTLIQKVRICLPQLKIPHASTKDPACCK